MSWTEGATERKDIPPNFLAWADAQCDAGTLERVVWDTMTPGTFQLHFHDEHGLVAMMTFSDHTMGRHLTQYRVS